MSRPVAKVVRNPHSLPRDPALPCQVCLGRTDLPALPGSCLESRGAVYSLQRPPRCRSAAAGLLHSDGAAVGLLYGALLYVCAQAEEFNVEGCCAPQLCKGTLAF